MKTLLVCLVATAFLFSCRKTPTTPDPPTTDPPTTDTPLTVHTKKMGGLRYWKVEYEYHQTQPTVFDTSYTYLDTFAIRVIDDTTLDLVNITTNNIVPYTGAITKPERLLFKLYPNDTISERVWVEYYYKNDLISIYVNYIDSVKSYTYYFTLII